MLNDYEDRLSRGVAQVGVGIATGDLVKLGEGVLSVLGVESNASIMEKYAAAEYETFVFDEILRLKGESAIHRNRIDTLEQRMAKLEWITEEFMKTLGEYGARVSDLGALLGAGFSLWKNNADARKRPLLGNALRNAFDPKLYAEGMTLRLMGILEQLEYGDIWVLRELKSYDVFIENNRVDISGWDNRPEKTEKPVPFRARDIRPQTMIADHLRRLERHGLVYTQTRATKSSFAQSVELTELTELGISLWRLLDETSESR